MYTAMVLLTVMSGVNCMCTWRGRSFSVFVFVERKVRVNVNLVVCGFSFVCFALDRLVQQLHHPPIILVTSSLLSMSNGMFYSSEQTNTVISKESHLCFLIFISPLKKKKHVRRMKMPDLLAYKLKRKDCFTTVGTASNNSCFPSLCLSLPVFAQNCLFVLCSGV